MDKSNFYGADIVMKSLVIRQIPPDLYVAIKNLALRNRRSMQQQILVLLECAKFLDYKVGSPVTMAEEIRNSLSGRELGDTVAEIREDRER